MMPLTHSPKRPMLPGHLKLDRSVNDRSGIVLAGSDRFDIALSGKDEFGGHRLSPPKMKVLQVPFCFAPDPIGGTEVYVANLSRDLQRLGVDVTVAAPGKTNRIYELDDLHVRRFAVSSHVRDVADLYGRGDAVAAAEFAKVLDEEAPDLIHLHAFTWTVSLRLIQLCKSRSIPIVFTYHTPTVSCQRGTLMLWGQVPCDGKLHVRRCTGCTLNSLGLYRHLAAAMGFLPRAFGRWFGRFSKQGKAQTALRMGDLIGLSHTVFKEMVSQVDHFVAVCDWGRDVLLINSVPAAKISVSHHGINWTQDKIAKPEAPSIDGATHELRLAFIGRMEASKGLHVLIKALQRVTGLNVRLDVYGVTQSPSSAAYQRRMRTLAGDDPRVSFHEAIPSSDIIPLLRRFDFLAVPSQWMETGPLVVLEAFAAGTPVICSKLGGPKELVRDGIDGLLVEDYGSVPAWAECLRRVVDDTCLRARLKSGVRPPKSSAEVTGEMLTLYRTLLGTRSELVARMGEA
jgi:glycosyltransferase involved in cell wall biosynthesis